MESESGKDAKQPGLREQRYTIRYPFAADAEMLELQSGTRLSGVTSDLSAGGCFVCAGHPLEVGARVRGTFTHNGQKVEMLAVVRVVKARFGMGLDSWTLIRTRMQHCWPGSELLTSPANRWPVIRQDRFPNSNIEAA